MSRKVMSEVLKSRTLLYRSFGEPEKVLELATVDVESEPKKGQVLVQWLASPINPLDINSIQGVYVYRPTPPVIGGSEGVGRVVKCSPGSAFSKGDHVTLFTMNTPFWTEYGIVDEEDLLKIDNRISVPMAATLMVNPPTAWVMLKDFIDLSPGDYIIQNSANSGVGRSVIELCKAFGYKSINIVRDRPAIESLKTELWKLGADHIFTEEEFAKEGRKFVKTLSSPPKLAMNGVGGRSSLGIAAVLEKGGTSVTYGGMSKKPHEFSTSALVFNDVRVRGVAVGMWMRQPENEEKLELCLREIQELAVAGKLTATPMDHVPLERFQEALRKSMESRQKKQLLIISAQTSPSKL
ncbi:unnamed protein product [Caenorhabditis auriculariae]|uniref:Enoyl-[acyl-carrier-protein] reductase, mitochondrial n=1 Tax=Caenorhabditis auriculariae TaxID=2777116 RepID=A0A8S1HS11_9PELO|nr:unnamed protein product [Caenorhabditis auriculariae]